MNVRISRDAGNLSPKDISAFLTDWPRAPSPDQILAALRGADEVALAWDGDRLVGFATAITDGALFAYVPLVEVVEDRRSERIGSRLVGDLLERFDDLYGVDLCCDDDVVPFYQRSGFSRVNGMVVRRPEVLG